MANVLVFGHQNPDNDAIMSTVVLSQLLNQLEYQGNTYTACCLGPLPAESAKLLEDAGVPAPTLIDAIEPAAEGAEPQLVILTDHNEPGQSVAGLENATIFGVVDHHRFGDFTTAAPLLGLLGTILGIIDTFKALATAGVSDPGQISGGIGTALFATGLGIAIALFCVVFHNFFQDSLERINDQLKILLIRAATGARAQDEVTHRVPTPLHSRTA